MEKHTGRRIRFSIFVFDTGSGELLRNGKRVRVPDQTARLLAALLENPGVVLTRDDLRSRLWPQGEVLDYDQSINRAISQLRAILRDRPSKPSNYIDTFPKRGYRFNGNVTTLTPTSETIEEPSVPEEPSIPGSAIESLEPALDGSTYPHPASDEVRLLLPPPQIDSQIDPQVSDPNKSFQRPFFKRPLIWATTAALIALAIFGFSRLHRSEAPHTLSLGIVPFEASGDGASTLAESFRLDLADSLSQVPTIEIRAAHSFDDLGQDEEKLQGRAQKLGIDTLLFGQFTVVGNLCQLHLELVRSRDGVHLLSLQYSGTQDELGTIRDRIDSDIFQRLQPFSRSSSLALPPPPSPAAYAAYLRGRSYLAHWTDDSIALAIQSFQEALEDDPSYARADAGISSSYFVLSQHGVGDRNDLLEKSRLFATKALALDPSLAEARAMLGEVALMKDWDFAQATKKLHRATDLDPSHAVYHQWLSILYCTQAQYNFALEEIDKAHRADPGWAPPYMTEIYIADSAGQIARADRAAATLLEKMPNWSLAHEQNATHLWATGRYLQAIDEWHRAAVLDNNTERAALEEKGADAFRAGGVPGYANVRLQAIATHKGISYEDEDFNPAEWNAYARNWSLVLDELRALIKDHSTDALQITTDPAYAPLHHDPQFLALLKNNGLPIPPDR